MKKIISLLILLLIVTGCNVKYEITISDDNVEENISFDLYKNGTYNADELELNVNSDEYIDSLIKTDLFVYDGGNRDTYNKTYKQDGNKYSFNLNYKYSKDEYLRSRAINECFDNPVIEFEDDRTYIHLTGVFKCYQDEDVDIIINSTNRIKKANGTKSGNGYKWTINQDNYNNVDIEIEISDKSNTRYYVYIVIAVIFGIAVVLFCINFFGNILGKNNVNDI